jgi:hypothetical protein
MRGLDVVSIAKDEFDSFINADPINISTSALAWLNTYVIPTLTSPPANYLALPD